jgi:hypothetical protein
MVVLKTLAARALSLALCLALPFSAIAQPYGPGPVPATAGSGAAITGSPTTGNCAKFASPTSIQDAGAVCGGGGGGSTAGIIQPPFISQHWYLPALTQVGGGAALTANRMVFIPFILFQPMSITDIGIRVTTAVSSGNISEAIYASNQTTGRPTGAALANTGGMSTTTVGLVDGLLAGGTTTLAAGTYWYATNADNSTAICQAMSSLVNWQSFMYGSANQVTADAGSVLAGMAVYAAQTYGTWPNVTSTSWSEVASSQLACLPQLKSY